MSFKLGSSIFGLLVALNVLTGVYVYNLHQSLDAMKTANERNLIDIASAIHVYHGPFPSMVWPDDPSDFVDHLRRIDLQRDAR